MQMQFVPRFQFYFRRLLRVQPIAFCMVLAGFIFAVCMLSVYLQQLESANAADADWHKLNQHAKEAGRSESPTGDFKLSLPAFNNTQLVESLNASADATKISLDEISFMLDENPSTPYVRYSATLTVSSAYPSIRHFLDKVRTTQPEMSLDSISCTRDDITTVELTCDLSLSAFYRKEAHG